MLRWALAIYMVLLSAAGPSLCCCLLTHLYADQQTLSPALPPCCQAPSGERDHGQGSCPHKDSDPKKPGCPCRQDGPKPVLIERAIEMPDQSQAGTFLLAPSFDSDPSVNGDPVRPVGPLPFQTAQHLLHVHHQLRC